MDKRVVLIDSQYLTKVSISTVVGGMNGLSLYKIFNYPHEVVSEIAKDPFDILITEYSDDYPAEINNILKIGDELNIPTLVVTNSENIAVIKRLLQSKVKGIITKKCSQEEIELAIVNVADKKRFYCNNVLELVLTEKSFAIEKGRELQHDLTARQIEVLELIANGFTTRQIAEKLHLSVHTINSHRKNILKKLSLTSPAHLAAFAIESGLVKMFE